MTDDVAELVLRDNYLQTQALGVAEAGGPAGVDAAAGLMRALEKAGRLDRAIEFLPTDEELVRRQAAGRGLTRPELAVLLAYAKLALYDRLLPTDLAEDAALAEELVGYFPPAIREGHRDAIFRHRLRREIVATVVTNALVNRMGPFFVEATIARTGRAPAEIARAWLATRDAFGLEELWRLVEALDGRVAAAVQTDMLGAIAASSERIVRWILAHAGQHVDVAAWIATLETGVRELLDASEDWLDDDSNAAAAGRRRHLQAAGVPADLADRVAGPDIVRIAGAARQPMRDVARLYFAIGDRLGFAWLREAARRARAETNWQRLAAEAVIDDLHQLQAGVTGLAIETAQGVANVPKLAERWMAEHKAALARFDGLLAEVKATSSPDLAALTVLARELRALTAM
jgi:glutamate dehydrogenase